MPSDGVYDDHDYEDADCWCGESHVATSSGSGPQTGEPDASAKASPLAATISLPALPIDPAADALVDGLLRKHRAPATPPPPATMLNDETKAKRRAETEAFIASLPDMDDPTLGVRPVPDIDDLLAENARLRAALEWVFARTAHGICTKDECMHCHVSAALRGPEGGDR